VSVLALLACAATEYRPAATVDSDGAELPEQIPAAERPWLPRLVLNEVQPGNDSTVMSEPGVFPDWIELHNDSAETLDLSRVDLRVEGGASNPLSGQLGPGEQALIFTSELSFDLAREGERLELLLDGWVIDRLATGQLLPDQAWARFPDGRDWAVTARPTPGWTNGSRPSDSLDPSDALFSPTVHSFQLTLSSQALADLGEDRDTLVPAALAHGAAWFPEIGVRLKGQLGSKRSLDQKAAWKADLNHVQPHSLYGQKKLTFNNMVQDPSYLAEHLAYTVWREAGLPAPRTSWTWLRVNEDDYGLYAVIESVDRTLLGRWFPDPDGRMWEGAYGTDLDVDEVEDFDFEQGIDDDRGSLMAVAEILEGSPTDAAIAELEQKVELDQWLRNMAVEILTLHWDGYTTSNNYRIYEEPLTGRLWILPWGTDQTFRDYRYGPYEPRGDLFEFCLANEACAARYDSHLLEVCDLVEALELEAVIDERVALLEAWVAIDPRAEDDVDQQLADIEEIRVTLRTWPDEVRAQVAARSE
jgi:hypothetical protein